MAASAIGGPLVVKENELGVLAKTRPIRQCLNKF